MIYLPALRRLLYLVGGVGLAIARAANPIITDVLTADPAALVYNGTVYIYTGHDEAGPRETNYKMNEWLCFSSTDMVNWTAHPSPLSLKDFTWARQDAWAGQVVARDGKFFWYVPMRGKDFPGFGIGVAVSDSPTGPFKDARGSPMVISSQTPDPKNSSGQTVTWDDIDPTVYIDDDGQAYIFWGNTECHWAKLKSNMTELDGPINTLNAAELPQYTEAPWIHKRNGTYYLSYAYDFPEKTAYATSDKITGPWKYQGIITELAGNCNTNHQAIIDFKGKTYFIYHNGGTPQGTSWRRSICIDYLNYNPDGTIQRVVQSSEGVGPAKGL